MKLSGYQIFWAIVLCISIASCSGGFRLFETLPEETPYKKTAAFCSSIFFLCIGVLAIFALDGSLKKKE